MSFLPRRERPVLAEKHAHTVAHTGISRKVVGKSARDNPVRY